MDTKEYTAVPEEKERGSSSSDQPDMAAFYSKAASAAATGYRYEANPDEGSGKTEPAEEEASEKRRTGDLIPGGPLGLYPEDEEEQTPSADASAVNSEKSDDEPQAKPASFAAFHEVPARQESEEDGQEEDEAAEPETSSVQADTSDEEDEEDEPMTIMSHLNELRRRLCRIVIIVILGFVAFYGVSEPLYGFLSAPLQACLPEGSKLIYTSPQGAFFTYMKVALVASLFGTSPFSFYQIWAFVAPGLYREEKRAVLPLAFFSSLFFVAGASFCFLTVFPIAFKFFMGFATDTIVPMISVEEYLSFALKLLIAFGVVFEMPLFAYFLSRFGILSPAFMRRSRRYAILVIFIVAAILTPPDVFSQVLMALPMLLLYEVSIYVSAMAYKKKSGKDDVEKEAS